MVTMSEAMAMMRRAGLSDSQIQAQVAHTVPKRAPSNPETIRIILPIPSKRLSPNQRPHWAALAKAKRQYSDRAEAITREALCGRAPLWPQCTVEYAFYHCIKRARDEDNLIASMKSGLDGICRAGLILNDSGVKVSVVGRWVDREQPRVVVIVTPVAS